MALFSEVTKGDVSIKPSSVEGAGNGVFAKQDLPAGKILPYYAVVKKMSKIDDDDDTYFMTITYTNENNKSRCLPGVVADGHPGQDEISSLPKWYRTASIVNEATTSAPNAIFIQNTNLTKDHIVECYKSKTPIVIALLVLPQDVTKGQELFTMYGSDYERDYEVYDVDTDESDDNINIAHDIVESNKENLGSCFKL